MPRRRKPATNDPPAFPPAVVIDTREQAPYSFADITDVVRGEPQLVTVRTEVRTLASGDYSIAGYEHRVAVERKSKQDLFGTVGQGRERFKRELARLNGMQCAAVVVEAEWSEIFGDPPKHSKMPPRSIFRSILAWQQRYPRVHWHFWPSRRAAEIVTFRVLERFWKERMEEARTGMVSTAVGVELAAGDEEVVGVGAETTHEG